jgi:hypothetical protein
MGTPRRAIPISGSAKKAEREIAKQHKARQKAMRRVERMQAKAAQQVRRKV